MANGREATVSRRDVAMIGNRCECNRTDLTESDCDFVSCDDASYSSVRNQASEPESPDFLSLKPVTILLLLSQTTLCPLRQNLLVSQDVQLVSVIFPIALLMIVITFVNVKFCA